VDELELMKKHQGFFFGMFGIAFIGITQLLALPQLDRPLRTSVYALAVAIPVSVFGGLQSASPGGAGKFVRTINLCAYAGPIALWIGICAMIFHLGTEFGYAFAGLSTLLFLLGVARRQII
jgi:hypothetical protein